MEEPVPVVLYETSHHLTRPFSSNYPPQQQDEAKQGLFSLLSVPGINQLKEKWNEYKHPRNLKKWISLFVSPSGEHVAVAAGNQITVLHKSDNYKEPCGNFSSYDGYATFKFGTWSDSHDVLGVIDDTDTLYFIKANGEEITRITKKQLKVSGQIIGLIVQGDPDTKSSFLCSFIMLTSDGLFHHIEVSQKPKAYPISPSTSALSLGNVSCLDYHPELSLLVIIDTAFSIPGRYSENAGFYCLSLWHVTGNLHVEQVFRSPQFEGLFSIPKGYMCQLTSPKVVISPQGKCIAALDFTGALNVFNLDANCSSVSVIELPNGRRKCLENIADVTWWSDRVLIAAKTNGVVSMLDVFSGKTLLEDDPAFRMPVLERPQRCKGCIFLLDNKSSDEGHLHPPVHGKLTDMQDEGHVAQGRFHQLDVRKSSWSLSSFSEKSVTEMYSSLVRNHQFETALEFANRHGLDKDEVFKSHWLHSAQGTDDVNKLLSNIKDEAFVLSECVDKLGPTEEAVKSLLAYGLRITEKYRFLALSEDDESSQIWDFCIARLQLLQLKDRLETFIGINMGRFAVQEFSKFQTMPLNEAAVFLAESGKIGALNLLFKRHPYSLSSFMLDILSSIPETVPVQTYGQLLPGRSPPTTIHLREEDWVECEKMVSFVNRLSRNDTRCMSARTESIVKQSLGFVWPSVDELSVWYKKRARDIDSFSGQLENCFSLLDFALRKGISELQPFNESISYLYKLIYSDETDEERNIIMSLTDWEQLSDYEKFKLMVDRVKEDNIVERLRARAIPFMLKSFPLVAPSDCEVTDSRSSVHCKRTDSFLIRWLKEIASDNKLDVCSVVIDEGCRDFLVNFFFRDGIEAVECALQCMYLCTLTDRWNTMASILSKLPPIIKDTESYDESLERRVKLAGGHVEAGRLLAYYQVPKPISFFLEAHSDPKGVKQILRLILSKFGRRQPGRSDNDWANMWRDMQLLQEKAFIFLDLEYMLMEFCRGLLKAGKFSLARNYLKGANTVVLAAEKAENLVIQAAREYFFSASSLTCGEIWKAKECLDLFPNSTNVKAEANIIEALTSRLPNFGITLLPMQYRQIRDPMEIINMVITSNIEAYLNVDELIEIAKLLGLSSPDDIAVVQEAVARASAVAGDLQLAFDLCLVLAKKGHGSIWDLCAAIARGPALDNVDINSRKKLLGFALGHCDEESIGELLHAWKELDMQSQCETLILQTGTNPPKFSVEGSSVISLPGYDSQGTTNLTDFSGMVEGVRSSDQALHFENIKRTLSTVAKDSFGKNETSWDSLLRENGKFLSFAALQLPWLLELSKKPEYGKNKISGREAGGGKKHVSIRIQAAVTILSWLAKNDIAPIDDLIAYLAKSIMEAPVTEEEDILGCSFLLNLVDAFHGVEIIEQQLKAREGYHEVSSIMNMGMTYSSLHNSSNECHSPPERRKLLLQKFQERPTPLSSDAIDKMDKVQSTFWREWKSKLAEQKLLTDQSRELKQIIPGVDAARFLSGDSNYIASVILSLIDSVKHERKLSLKDVLKLADNYGLNRTEVLLHYFTSLLVSEVWTNEDITGQISEHKEELLAIATKVIGTISSDVYPVIDGCNKQRLAYIYNILSECYSVEETIEEPLSSIHSGSEYTCTLPVPQFYSVLNQECTRVSFLKNLNFKNLVGLGGMKTESFNDEIYIHIDEFSVEALAEMVKILTGIHAVSVSKGLLSWQAVYKHYILNTLASLFSGTKGESYFSDPDCFQKFIGELEQNYACIRIYLRSLSLQDVLEIMKQYYRSSLPSRSLPYESEWMECLIMLLNFWIRLTNDVKEIVSCDNSEELINFSLESLSKCFKIFVNFVMVEELSLNQVWGTISDYVKHGLGDLTAGISNFCRAMVFHGCMFDAINKVFSEAVILSPSTESLTVSGEGNAGKLCHLYVNILDPLLFDLENESGDRHNLHNLLSSLSKLDGNLDDLKMVREVVWGRLSMFSDNMHLKSHVRVIALELMQSIAGRNLKGLPSELLYNVQPWGGWEESQHTTIVDTVDGSVSNPSDASGKYTNTLVALKSTRIGASISSSIEILADDLRNLDSAVSCFSKLSEVSNSEPHLKALQAILEEWEGLFTERKDDVDDPSEESPDAGDNWTSEDWDEGWESFQEEPPSEKEKQKGGSVSIHPLHMCWMQIIEKLISLSKYEDVLKLVDRSLTKSNVILLDHDDTKNLVDHVLGVDCFTALKLALLLPYEAIQLQCLDAVETKLEEGGLSGAMREDRELFILFLSSGVISTIATNPVYGNTFSYFCYMAGHFSRLCQESQLSIIGGKGDEDNFFVIFRAVLFPSLISELVKIKQTLLAGFLVSKFLDTNPSFSLLNVAEAILRRYLEGRNQLQHDLGKIDGCLYLGNTVSILGGRLGSSIHAALSILCDTVK